MSLPAYRSLLRASRRVFLGDERMLNAARASIRNGFRDNASLEPTNPKVQDLIKHAQEVAAILRHNTVQGKREGEIYKLRIHEDTERGDNDTVKLPSGKTVKIDGKTCADR